MCTPSEAKQFSTLCLSSSFLFNVVIIHHFNTVNTLDMVESGYLQTWHVSIMQWSPGIDVVPRKRVKGGAHYFMLRQGIFVTSLHFTTKKRPCLNYHNLQQLGYCKPTYPPSTSLIQFNVYISQACVASRKWTSAGVLTFQEKDSKFHAMSFTSCVEKAN